MGAFLETNLVGIVAVLIALIVPVLLFIKGKNRKELSYEIISNTPLITSDEEIRKKFKIVFEDEEIKEDVSLVLVRIVNTGNVSIKKEEFIEDIVIGGDRKFKVFTADLKETSPSNIRVEINNNAGNMGLIFISPLLLNPKDEMTLKLLIASYENELKVSSRIVGVREIIKVKEKTSSKSIFLILGINIGLISFMMFFGDLRTSETFLFVFSIGALTASIQLLGSRIKFRN